MKSTLISKENNVAKFTMEFTAEEFEAAVVDVYKVQKDRFVVDGFRKGKAPRSIIEKKYGEEIFFDDAINELVAGNYGKALEELELMVIDQPRAEFSDIKKGEGFTVTISVECYPEIEVKDYTGVEIETVSAEVTDADVEKELESRAKRNSRMVAVERAAKEGDTVIIDYEGWTGDVQFDGGTAERQPLKLGSGTFIPGFEEQLVGVAAGEDKDVVVTFPEEYHSPDLAGKEAVFKCKVHEVKEEEIPEINDEFVKDISEFDTLDELKADIKENLSKAAEARADMQMKNSVIEKIYEANDFDVPNAMVETEIDDMLNAFDQQLQSQGMNFQTYIQYIGKDISEFREEVREDAFKRVKTRMLVTAIADQENFEVTEADVDAEIESMAKQYGMDVDNLKEILKGENIKMIEGDIKVKKAIEFVYEKAVRK